MLTSRQQDALNAIKLGHEAEQLLADHLKTGIDAHADNLSIRFRSADDLDRVEDTLRLADPARIQPTPDAKALEGLKFSEALPASLAAEVFCARFADPQAVDSVRYHVIVNSTLELPMHVAKRGLCAISALAHALMTDPDTLEEVARKVAPQAELDPMAAQRGARQVQEQIEMAVERAKTDE